MAYTTVFATLDDDAKFLFYEDAQRGTTGFDDTVFICQRLGIADLRRGMGEQECLYARKVVRKVSCMRGARTLRSLYIAWPTSIRSLIRSATVCWTCLNGLATDDTVSPAWYTFLSYATHA